VRTAVEKTILLYSMADDFAPTMDAYRRQCMDRTLEAIEGVRYTLHSHIERFIVVVPADFTTSHKIYSFSNFVNQLDGDDLTVGMIYQQWGMFR
jgi:hypothetical protein